LRARRLGESKREPAGITDSRSKALKAGLVVGESPVLHNFYPEYFMKYSG